MHKARDCLCIHNSIIVSAGRVHATVMEVTHATTGFARQLIPLLPPGVLQ